MISPTKIDALTRVFNKFKPAIGRLYRRKDRTFLTGTCFLVAPDHAVTCHHVIRVDQEPVELDLVFEGAPGDFVPVANIHSLGAGIDIADLSLARLVALPFFPLSVSEPWGNPFATFGYPASHGGGGTTTFGEILGPTSVVREQRPVRRMELRTDANQITQGFSGAPVFVVQSDGEGFVAACISETGSVAYPSVPSCAPFSEAQDLFRMNPKLVAMAEKPSDEYDSLVEGPPKDEAARWKVTKQIVGPRPIIEREHLDELARQTFEAVSQTMAKATEEDDEKTLRLAVIVSGLRAKYQKLQFDFQEPLLLAEEGRSKGKLQPARLERLVQQIAIVAADFRKIDRILLAFAKTHGAEIHSCVLDGYCFHVADDLANHAFRRAMIGPYEFENLERLILSFRSLLKFDLEALSHGFSEPGWIKPLPPDVNRLIVAAISGPEPYVCVLGETPQGGFDELGHLTARKTKLFGVWACLDKMSQLSIIGGSVEHIYRWRLSSPTPYTDVAVRTQHEYGVADLFYLDQTGSDIIAQTYDGDFLAVHEQSVEHLAKADDFMPDVICWRAPRTGDLHLIRSSNSIPRSFIRYELHDSVVEKQRIYLSEILDHQFGYLFEDLDQCPSGKTGSLYDMFVQHYLGAPCLVSVTSLWPQGTAALFLDPISLEPIRTPVVMDETAVIPRIGSFQGTSILVATFLQDGDNRHALGAWDITDPTQRSAPRIVDKWHEGHGDATWLVLINKAKGFDAYFSTEPSGAGRRHELWKFSWENKAVTAVRPVHEGLLNYLSVVPK